MQQWFIKPGLILLCYNQHSIFIRMECLWKSLFFDCFTRLGFVQLFLGVGNAVVLYLAGKCHQYIQVRISLFPNLTLELQQIPYSMQPGRCYNHSLGLAADLMTGHIAELFQHDGCFLRDIMRMQRFKLADSPNPSSCIQFGIIRNRLCNLIIHVIGHVVLQYIENKAFFDGLTHRIYMKRMVFAIFIPLTKHLQRLILRGSSKGKKRQIFMNTLCCQFIQQLVFVIFSLCFFLVFQLRVFLQNLFSISQCPFKFTGSVACLRGMRLIYDNGKPFIPGTNLFIDNRKLLKGRNNNACARFNRIF